MSADRHANVGLSAACHSKPLRSSCTAKQSGASSQPCLFRMSQHGYLTSRDGHTARVSLGINLKPKAGRPSPEYAVSEIWKSPNAVPPAPSRAAPGSEPLPKRPSVASVRPGAGRQTHREGYGCSRGPAPGNTHGLPLCIRVERRGSAAPQKHAMYRTWGRR